MLPSSSVVAVNYPPSQQNKRKRNRSHQLEGEKAHCGPQFEVQFIIVEGGESLLAMLHPCKEGERDREIERYMYACVQVLSALPNFLTHSRIPRPENGPIHSGSSHANEHNQDIPPQACPEAHLRMILDSVMVTVVTSHHRCFPASLELRTVLGRERKTPWVSRIRLCRLQLSDLVVSHSRGTHSPCHGRGSPSTFSKESLSAA